MLTEKELMIGDWVMYNPNVFIDDEYETAKEWFPTQINSGEDIDLAIEGCYDSIPLTSEILEKNGWMCNNEDEKFFPQTWVGGGMMLQGADDCGYRIVVTSDYDDEDTNSTPFILLYVHELQHALRLRRIKKEIEL